MRRSQEIRRRPTRHTVKIPCQVVRVRDFRLVADRMENLSTWGMLVTPADPVLTGERLLVSFQVPGTDRYIDVEAQVTRVVHGRRPHETTRKLGLEFVNLGHYERYQLRKALRGVPVAPPNARPGRRDGKRAVRALASTLRCDAPASVAA